MTDPGWRLFAHPLFLEQLGKLEDSVTKVRRKDPKNWARHADAKLLAAVLQLVFETIPIDPTRPEFRQGGTLGADRKHWFRAKFASGRYRLFFRFSSSAKVIVFAWVNDSKSLRTYGAKTDAYAVFKRMLDGGNPPDDLGELLAVSETIEKPQIL